MPTVHTDFTDRVRRLNEFIEEYKPPSEIEFYIDAFATDYETPNYENMMHAWPDQHCIIDTDKILTDKVVYGTEGENDALAQNNYGPLLAKLVNE